MTETPENEKALPELPITERASPRRLRMMRQSLIGWGTEEVVPFSIVIPKKENDA